uniref:Legume lectin domain-containing protein n=1 Tax=Oryza brachyantha TaxID=4533 RepID=J3LWK0_ORYBR
MSSRRVIPMLFLLCASLLTFHQLITAVSSLSFNVYISRFGYDIGELLFHQIDPANLTSPYPPPVTDLVLPYPKNHRPVAARCDCSRIDAVIYARPVQIVSRATQEIASFKMTLCATTNHEDSSTHGAGGLVLFMIPYPCSCSENGVQRIDVELDRSCMGRRKREEDRSSTGLGSDDDGVVCAHVRYDGATQILTTDVRTGDHRSCVTRRRVHRSNMPREAVVGFASKAAGHPIRLQNVLTWAFHSTFQSKEDDDSSSVDWGQQRLRFDPWNRNAELSLRYQRNWQRNLQLTCSLSISLGYGNTNDASD